MRLGHCSAPLKHLDSLLENGPENPDYWRGGNRIVLPPTQGELFDPLQHRYAAMWPPYRSGRLRRVWISPNMSPRVE